MRYIIFKHMSKSENKNVTMQQDFIQKRRTKKGKSRRKRKEKKKNVLPLTQSN
jgi:hypothetical protein